MTPQQKAKELIDRYLNTSFNCNNCTIPFCAMDCTKIYTKEAAECALITVEEILNISYFRHEPTEDDLLYKNYWQEVKKELLKQQNNG